MRLAERPVVRFLVLGGLLFAADRWRAPGAGEEVIEIRAAEVETLRQDWRRRLGREPSERELRAVVASAADEEILFREALRLGLDQSDAIAQRRLIANLRFLGAEPEAKDEELLREAYALGLQRSDLVVRRRLVQAVEERLRGGPAEPPSDRELEEAIARHRERFEVPMRVRFTHVLLSADRHRADVDRAARALRASLIARRQGPEAAERTGDPFLLGNHYGPASAQAIAAAFGAELAAAVAALEPGRWSEPIRSAFGEHLVWVEERTAARLPAFAEVRERALLSLLAEREEQARSAGLAALRGRYRIETDGVVALRR